MFELHVSCTKDFDSLSINFKDGTSFVQEGTTSVQESPKESKAKIPGSEKKASPIVAKVHPENALIQKFEKKSSVRNVENAPIIPKITEVRVDPNLNNFEI